MPANLYNIGVLQQVVNSEMSYMCRKPEYISQFVAQIPRDTKNTDVRKFQISLRVQSNTTLKNTVSQLRVLILLTGENSSGE